ncbi:MAG: hypothetical protein IT176_03075 [Acidobacteria bacterium]|nr:hypothetical protein [Acidobacteriota bacterium]
MGEGPHRYRADVLRLLHAHGVAPRPSTPPELVHEFVSDLYRFEIRRLRGRLLAKEFPRGEYAGRVATLRQRYRVISMRPHEWLEA